MLFGVGGCAGGGCGVVLVLVLMVMVLVMVLVCSGSFIEYAFVGRCGDGRYTGCGGEIVCW